LGDREVDGSRAIAQTLKARGDRSFWFRESIVPLSTEQKGDRKPYEGEGRSHLVWVGRAIARLKQGEAIAKLMKARDRSAWGNEDYFGRKK
jgi:hypothetical protein